MEQKKYHSIVRMGHRSTKNVFNNRSNIIIQEKIDGANASFRLGSNSLESYSRNRKLDEDANLNGFYEWVLENVNKDKVNENYIYFGEWLNPHKVKYEKYMHQFFLFDVYDTSLEKYVEFNIVKEQAEILNINLVPVFYEGLYKGFEHLESFIGKTNLDGRLGDKTMGEGIVVKNVDYIDRFGRQLFVKLVADEFREVQKQKAPKNPNRPKTKLELFAESVITVARVEKAIYNLIDEKVISKDWSIEDMGIVLRNINPILYEDVLKEESEMIPKDSKERDIKRAIGRLLPNIVKNILNSEVG